MNISTRVKAVWVCFGLFVLSIVTGNGSTVFAWDIVLEETFSGSGSHVANGGPSGFENPGWFIAGTPGSFGTNGFSEDVFQVATVTTTSSLDGLFRIIGTDSFTATAEFSNPVLSTNGFTSAGMNIVDSPDQFSFGLRRNSQGEFTASIVTSVNGSIVSGGSLDLGNSVDRFALRLQYEPDLVNGGGFFNGYVDVNESGVFSLVGTVDGTQYTPDAIMNRTLFLGTAGYQNNGSVELDHLTISNSVVPEPASCVLLTCGLVAVLVHRRRRKQL